MLSSLLLLDAEEEHEGELGMIMSSLSEVLSRFLVVVGRVVVVVVFGVVGVMVKQPRKKRRRKSGFVILSISVSLLYFKLFGCLCERIVPD